MICARAPIAHDGLTPGRFGGDLGAHDVFVDAPLAGHSLDDLIRRAGEVAGNAQGNNGVRTGIAVRKEARCQPLVARGGIGLCILAFIFHHGSHGIRALCIARQRRSGRLCCEIWLSAAMASQVVIRLADRLPWLL